MQNDWDGGVCFKRIRKGSHVLLAPPEELGICTNHGRRMCILPLLIYQNLPTRKMEWIFFRWWKKEENGVDGSNHGTTPPSLLFRCGSLTLCTGTNLVESLHMIFITMLNWHWRELEMYCRLWHICKCYLNKFIYGFLTLWTMIIILLWYMGLIAKF
jgi:hypothetical protein